MVEHPILLNKLEHYEAKSYLSYRTKFVSICGIDSEANQRSILVPLLLIIYINDIPQVSKIDKFILFAGDANIIISGNKIAEVSQKLSEICKTAS